MTDGPTGEVSAAGDEQEQLSRKQEPLLVRVSVAFWFTALGAVAVVLGTSVGNWAVEVVGDRSEPLSAVAQWPTLRSCDSATIVAMPAGGLPIDELATQSNQFDERSLATEAGAGAYASGNLTLLLTTEDPSPSYVTDIRAVIFDSQPTTLDWVLDVEGGCSGVYEREYHLNLASASPSVVDAGLRGYDSEFSGQSGPIDDYAVRSDPLWPFFKIEYGSAVRLLVRVASRCGHEVEWGLILDYTHEGSPQSLLVGSADEPFRSVEGTGPRYVFEEGIGGSPRQPVLREVNFEATLACD